VDHLRAYLSAAPDAEDAAAIRRLLEQTRTELARWN
jgi:hypothetical protein